MAKKKEVKVKKKNFNIWRVVVWGFGIVLFLCLVVIVGFKIWFSTWQTYKSEKYGFEIKVPRSWDIKDPEKDKSDTQPVYDHGSILKIGDENTDFSEDSGKVFRYKGEILIYIYSIGLEQKKDLGFETIKVGSNGLSRDVLFGDGEKAFMFSTSVKETNNPFINFYLSCLQNTLIHSFSTTN